MDAAQAGREHLFLVGDAPEAEREKSSSLDGLVTPF